MRIVLDLFLYPIIKFVILRDILSNILSNILGNILGNTLSAILGITLSIILGITLSIILNITLSIILSNTLCGSQKYHHNKAAIDSPCWCSGNSLSTILESSCNWIVLFIHYMTFVKLNLQQIPNSHFFYHSLYVECSSLATLW